MGFVDLRFFEARRAILQKEVGVLDKVFVDFETTIPSWDIYSVRKFFRTYRKIVTSPSSSQARAKLDARDFTQKTKRDYPQWLTPDDLYRSLNVKVCKYRIRALHRILISAAV
jgi:hypothetical protein